MARMSSNAESPRRDFGDRSQLTNWVFDSGMTFHMASDVSNFIRGLLVEIYKYIEVAYGHFFTAKITEKVQIKCKIIMGNPSLLCHIMYYLNQTCAIDYLPLLR